MLAAPLLAILLCFFGSSLLCVIVIIWRRLKPPSATRSSVELEPRKVVQEAAGEIKAAASGAVTSVMQARGARRGMRRLEEERDEPQASGGRGDAHDSDDETLVLAAATTSAEPDPFDDLPPWALAVVEEAVATAHAVRAGEDHGLD
jgi:hypothetical protein